MLLSRRAVWAAALLLFLTAVPVLAAGKDALDFGSYEWTEVNDDAEWEARAGLQVVNLHNRFYLMGGRTPNPPTPPPNGPIPGDSKIWDDVWQSVDLGASWQKISDGNWPERAYFQAVTKDSHIYVLGGQNFNLIPNPNPNPGPNDPPFISVSDFYNDVWRSKDGISWTQMTGDAGWAGRAGLSAGVFKGHIYIMGGSFNDDPAVIGGPPVRVYFNDVWRSKDGANWEQVTDNAPWAPRAGAVVVVKNGYMYLLGGEDGFTCTPGNRCPPYYNDVWRTRDGAEWELVTDAADWSSRPGHQVAVLLNHFILFGGFGLSTDPGDPFKPSNPVDMWVSKDGAQWEKVSDSPWNANSPGEVKYDFDVLTVEGGQGGLRPSIFTFGGDRETFDFTDPTNYLNVDNDVWRFSPPVE